MRFFKYYNTISKNITRINNRGSVFFFFFYSTSRNSYYTAFYLYIIVERWRISHSLRRDLSFLLGARLNNINIIRIFLRALATFFFFLLLFYYYFFFQKNLASFFSRDTEEEIRACESRLIIALAVTQRIILGSQSIFYKPCFLFLNTVYMHIARPRDILTHGAAEVTSFFYLCGSPRPNC